MRALVLSASLLIVTLGAAAPAAQAQVFVPPPIPPVQPIGTSALPPYGYVSTPYGLAGSVPPFGSDGLASSSMCIDPQTGQQTILQTANVPDALASHCFRMGVGQ